MRIAIDLRSLQSGTISGVENYTLNLLEHLLAMDKRNTYTLFYNGFRRMDLADFRFINAKTVKTPLPNKFLNLGLKFNLIRLEKLLGGFDCLLMPNLNMMNVGPKVKIALTVHDLSFVSFPEFYNLKRNLWHRYLNIPKLLTRADVVFAVSHYTKNDLIRYYNLPGEKIKVIYPAVDLQIFHPGIKAETLRKTRNIYGLPGEFFLFLNTLEPRKNLVGAIRAFELAKTGSHLVIAGKRGWKTGQIMKKINNSKQKSKIHYIGYVAEEHKPALLKMSQALLYPSFYEGFGFQALEAMAVGTPVVASQITSLPEVASDAAILINPYNLRDMAHALEELNGNLVLRSLLVQKGLQQAKKFNWEVTAKQTLGYLESLK